MLHFNIFIMRSASQSFRRKRRGSFQPLASKQDTDLFYLKQSLPDRYECFCALCQRQVQKTLAKQQHFDPSELPQKISSPQVVKLDGENSYSFVLRNILEAANLKRSLGICTPDTVLFEGGAPQCVVVSPLKEDYFKVIRQKEKLTFLEIRKFLDQRRKKYMAEAKSIRVEKTNTSYQTNNPEAPFFRLESSSLTFRDSLKSKLENYSSLKTHHRDSELQEPLQIGPLKQKQICLVNFNDNTTQVMNHLEYSFLFERRKIDPYWLTVSSIQNIVKPFGGYQYKRVQFSLNRITDQGLYQRAFREAKIILEDFQRDQWVAWEDEEAYRNQLRITETKYLLYSVYRIIHFLKLSESIAIWKGSFFFMKDVFGSYYFCNATNIHFCRQQKASAIDESKEEILQEVYEGSLKIMYEDQQRQVVSKICRDLLSNAIELRKIQLQLSDYTKPSQATINKIFDLFHPNFDSKLQKTMQSVNWKRDVEELMDEVRQRTQFLIHNSQGLKILHLHGIYFTKTLEDAKPIRRSFSAKLTSERRMSTPLFVNNFRVSRK